jgi:hypothetical protein
VTYTTQDFHLVLLNFHSAAAPVTELPSRQFSINPRDIDRQTRRQAFNNRDQRATV